MAGSITYGLNRIIASFQGIWLALRSMRYGCRARGFEEKWDGEFRDYGEDDRCGCRNVVRESRSGHFPETRKGHVEKVDSGIPRSKQAIGRRTPLSHKPRNYGFCILSRHFRVLDFGGVRFPQLCDQYRCPTKPAIPSSIVIASTMPSLRVSPRSRASITRGQFEKMLSKEAITALTPAVCALTVPFAASVAAAATALALDTMPPKRLVAYSPHSPNRCCANSPPI